MIEGKNMRNLRRPAHFGMRDGGMQGQSADPVDGAEDNSIAQDGHAPGGACPPICAGGGKILPGQEPFWVNYDIIK